VQRNPRLALVNNELAGAKQSLGKLEEASSYERQADQFTPNDSLFHWMIGRRLQDLGMTELAEKHFQRANQLDPGSQLPNKH
jgi:tetratricopeptide (TPR) repeat protein